MNTTTARSRSGQNTVVLAAVAVMVGAFFFAWLAQSPSSAEDQLRQVTTTIRCPVCIGESIADSTAPISLAMRDEAQAQLQAGATPQEVRDFFADAYGPDVLLMPALGGPGAVVWMVPLGVAGAVLVGLAVTFVVWLRRRAHERPAKRAKVLVAAGAGAGVGLIAVVAVVALNVPVDQDRTHADGATGALDVLAAAVENRPADADIRLAYGTALKTAGQDDQAHEQFAAAYRLEPLNADVAYLYASVLLATGELDQAAHTLDGLLDHSPEHAAALLMRGVMLRQAGDERAAELLTRFLKASPDDPAADAVRAMLRAD